MKKLTLITLISGILLASLTLSEFVYVVSYRSNQRISIHQISVWIIAMFQTGYLAFLFFRGYHRSKSLSMTDSLKSFWTLYESDSVLIICSFVFYQVLCPVQYLIMVFYKNVFNLINSYEDFLALILFWFVYTQYAYFGILFRHIVMLPRMEEEGMSLCKTILLHLLSWIWVIYSGVTLFLLIVILSRDITVENNSKLNFSSMIFFLKTSLVVNLFKKRTSTKFAYLLFLFLNIITLGQTFSGIVREVQADEKIDFYEIYILSCSLLIVIYFYLLWKTTREIKPFLRNCYSEILRSGSQRHRISWLRRSQREDTEIRSINQLNILIPSGISAETKENLKTMIKPFESTQDREATSDFTCVICSEEMTRGEDVMTIPCGHTFHPNCIWPWFDIRSTCPTCRKDLK